MSIRGCVHDVGVQLLIKDHCSPNVPFVINNLVTVLGTNIVSTVCYLVGYITYSKIDSFV